MPVAELKVGPMEATEAAELVGEKGVHNQALALLRANAVMNPPELVAAGAAPYDEARTKALTLSDVADVVDVDGTIEDATVRGVTDDERLIHYVYRVGGDPHGRSLKGMVPYSKLKKSAQHDPSEGPVDPDKKVSALEEERDELLRRVRNLEARTPAAGPHAAQSPHAATAADLTPGVGAQVPDGYDDFTVEQARQALDDADPEQRRAIVQHERSNKNRKTVVEYTPKDAAASE